MQSIEWWRWMEHNQLLDQGWWYLSLIVPVGISMGCIPLVSLVAIRRIAGIHWRFGVLLSAWLPMVFMGPSLYARLDFAAAVGMVGYTLPATPHHISIQTAEELGSYFDTLALIGLAGTGLLIPQGMLWIVLAVPGLQPVMQRVSRTITRIATRTFGKRARIADVQPAPLGTLTILSGQRQGVIETIRPHLCIGSAGDLMLPDAVVSRRHVQLDYKDEQVVARDLDSRNGTYLERHGQCIALGTQAYALQTGDYLMLGDPDFGGAVRLLFERKERMI